MNQMVRLTIDNQTVKVPDGSTILDAARQLGVNIPTLCFLAGVKKGRPSCLACVVKVGNDSRLVPSCATKAGRDACRLGIAPLCCSHNPPGAIPRNDTRHRALQSRNVLASL